jgi:hypothetical protein
LGPSPYWGARSRTVKCDQPRRWRAPHVGCDRITVFADLTPFDGDVPEVELARFFN